MHLTSQLTELNQTNIGLILLQADETTEWEFRKILPENILCHTTRLKSSPLVSADGLKTMESEISRAMELLPEQLEFDAVAFACTSGSIEIGADRVNSIIQNSHPTKNITNPFNALIAACNHLNLKNISLLSPYVDEVNNHLRDAIKTAGVNVVEAGNFNLAREYDVVRISPKSIMNAAIELCTRQRPEALFLSCTNLRTFALINELEETLKIPVLSSNQVLAWHLSKLTKVTINGPGQIFRA